MIAIDTATDVISTCIIEEKNAVKPFSEIYDQFLKHGSIRIPEKMRLKTTLTGSVNLLSLILILSFRYNQFIL